ncbi:MAG TPA: hypothetical protein VMQ44_01475, partial [Candidatus Saccharimonadales bacterium]|nr:hypothetical protein [Candidatus Saccharimonadales bacterium]
MTWLIGHAQAFDLGLSLGAGKDTGLTFNDYFTQIVNVALYAALAFSIAILVYAGIVYAQSQGDASKVSMAKELASGV